VRNYEAHGLNKYLNTIQDACADTRLGNHNLGEWLRSGTTDSDSDYVYWLDQTSGFTTAASMCRSIATRLPGRWGYQVQCRCARLHRAPSSSGSSDAAAQRHVPVTQRDAR
jgi:hypothetical protein